MGTLDLDFRPIGDDGRTAYGRSFDVEPRPVPVVEPPDWDGLARRAVLSAVDARANRLRAQHLYYLACLDIACAGLSLQPWEEIIDYLSGRIASEEERRWQGFGGETSLVNMKAMRIVAREMMAAQHMQPAE